MTRFQQRRGSIRPLIIVLAAGAVSLASVCDEKTSQFFETSMPVVNVVTDQEAPAFGDPQPDPSVTVFCGDNIMWTLTDPMLSDGRPGSGVDPASVTATTGSGMSLPVTANGMYTANTSGLADGPVTVSISYRDFVGNMGLGTFNFDYDCTNPMINLTNTPTSPQESMDPMVMFEFAGSITEMHPSMALSTVTRPGANGTCGDTDDEAWPSGTGPGQVDGQTVDLPASGSFMRAFTAYNGKMPGDPPSVATYCTNFSAYDTTRDKFGVERPNETHTSFRIDLTWMAPVPTTGDIEGVVTVDGTLPNEPVTLTLTQGGSPVAVTSTLMDGSYSFPDLPPGDYDVTITPPTGTVCLLPTRMVMVEVGMTATENFECVTPNLSGTYTGQLWYWSGDINHLCCAWSEAIRSIAVAVNSPISIQGLDFAPSALPQISGDVAEDGTISISATATIAGIPNVSIVVTGTVDGTTLDIFLTLGGQGELPGGLPITYRFTGTKQ